MKIEAAQRLALALAEQAEEASSKARSPTRTFVEMAHDALIRNWSRLLEWIDVDRAGRHVRTRLTAAAGDWKNSGGDPSYLYTGTRLTVSEEWAGSHRGRECPHFRPLLAQIPALPASAYPRFAAGRSFPNPNRGRRSSTCANRCSAGEASGHWQFEVRCAGTGCAADYRQFARGVSASGCRPGDCLRKHGRGRGTDTAASFCRPGT